MLLSMYYFLAKMFRFLPKTKKLTLLDMSATFFVPINNHYICDDLIDISKHKREPALYSWINNLNAGSVLFDIGTSYGQESSLASSLIQKNISVLGFDCSLYQSHFCALNRRLNGNRFRFIFAAIGSKSGDLLTIRANSDTHIPALHKKNVPYEYDVMSLALDDFAASQNIQPTHLKIDVDGAEFEVLKGAKKILKSQALKEVFIEIDNENIAIKDYMASLGFTVKWQVEKELNVDILFSKSA